MKIYLIIFFSIVILGGYIFWLILKKGKGGRISGDIVEKKSYKDALVVDVRWRKEYERGHSINAINLPIKLFKNNSSILDNYKDKDIILYCVVDITSRNTEKLLKERGFTKLHIGDGIKQYNYGKPKFKNVIMAEMKYLRTILNHSLLNLGTVELEKEELKATKDNVLDILKDFNKEKTLFIYSDKEEDAFYVSKKLSELDYKVINLIEPMNIKKYTFTTYNKQDFLENKEENKKEDCT